MIKIPDFQIYIQQDKTEYADITNIIEFQNDISNSIKIDTIVDNVDSIIDTNFVDTILVKDDIVKDSVPPPAIAQTKKTSTIAKLESLKKTHQPIEFPDEDKRGLHSFFQSLIGLEKNKSSLLRILHYGDSQIEGDRITSYIRNAFQEKFGGSGIGLFAVKDMRDNNVSIQLNVSDNWRRMWIRDVKLPPEEHQKFGIMMEFARFNGFNDYAYNTQSTYTSTIHLKRQSFSYPLSQEFSVFKVFYGFNKKPFMTHMECDGENLEGDIVPPINKLNVLEWHFTETPKEFTLHFNGEDSPNIFAISLDGKTGVAVDNLPLRGSSGTEFTKTNRQFYTSMYQQLNVKLVLLQFGVNVVPNIVNDYTYYENNLYKQLKYLKSIQPNLSIVILGVSDMSRKKGAYYESYPNIEKIRDAQRKAAFRAGCPFWDIYTAMGGKNSMPSWVFANPPMAQKDFVHFNHKGSRVIAKMFVDALLEEYNEFKTQPTE